MTPFFHVRLKDGRPEISGQVSWRKAFDAGTWVSWQWDGTRLCVQNDRYGCVPLFYYTKPGELGLSTSLLTLLQLGAPTDLDDAGLAVFLRLGFFIGEHTAFRAIRAIPPNAAFQWSADGLRVDGQLAIRKPQRIAYDDAVAEYADRFKRAIQRRLPSEHRFCAPLSGGRDSRHIVLELCAAGRPPTECVSYLHPPPRKNTDAVAAAEVCRTLGVPHVILEQPPSRAQSHMRTNCVTNFCSDELNEFLVVADYVAGRFPMIFDGIGGDVLSAGLFLTAERDALYKREAFTALAENLCAGFPVPDGHEHQLTRLLPRRFARRFSRELAISCIVEELKRHVEAPNPVGSFFFWNRTRREIAAGPLGILERAARVACPYLDHDLYDFLASLPSAMLLDHRFHTATILRTYPAFASLPFEENVEARPVHAPSHFTRFARELLRYAVSRPAPLLRYSYLLPRLVVATIDAEYAESWFSYRWLGPHVLFLLQLCDVARGRVHATASLDAPRETAFAT